MILTQMPRRNKSLESRVRDLEEFHNRVKLGQKWFLCGLAGLGSVVAFASYLLSSINQWNTWNLNH